MGGFFQTTYDDDDADADDNDDDDYEHEHEEKEQTMLINLQNKSHRLQKEKPDEKEHFCLKRSLCSTHHFC